jgi:hypothetical protein
LSGADLGNQFRGKTNQTIKKFGVATLSEFVETQMTGEVTISGAGPETTFSLSPDVRATNAPDDASISAILPRLHSMPMESAGTLSSSSDLLRLWKSPNASYKLAVHRTSGAARALSNTAQPLDDEVVLSPPSAADHRRIAQRYVETHIPGDLRAEFESKLDRHQWWIEWDGIFRLQTRMSRIHWLNFREQELLNLLDAELTNQGITEVARNAARETVHKSRIKRNPAVSAAPLTPHLNMNDAPSGKTLKQAVISAIEHMEDDDVRRIWLPAGTLFDAFNRIHR